MKIFIQKLFGQPLLWAFLTMLALGYGAYNIFSHSKEIPVLAAISTGLVVMFGYFATHHLQIARKQKEEKFKQCLELIKKLRFFILETNIKGTEQQSKLRDELQDAYFAFSLLTTGKSYKLLSKMMDKFKIFLASQNPSDLCNFKKAQSRFVNSLRKEFFTDKEIEFETYDFNLKK